MSQIIKGLAKVALLVVGNLMLFGGGVCVVTNVAVTVQDSTLIPITKILLSVSALGAFLGWWLIKWADSIQSAASARPDSGRE